MKFTPCNGFKYFMSHFGFIYQTKVQFPLNIRICMCVYLYVDIYTDISCIITCKRLYVYAWTLDGSSSKASRGCRDIDSHKWGEVMLMFLSSLSSLWRCSLCYIHWYMFPHHIIFLLLLLINSHVCLYCNSFDKTVFNFTLKISFLHIRISCVFPDWFIMKMVMDFVQYADK